ncbi:unnamed protein product, partial [Pylaiella littoralis]
RFFKVRPSSSVLCASLCVPLSLGLSSCFPVVVRIFVFAVALVLRPTFFFFLYAFLVVSRATSYVCSSFLVIVFCVFSSAFLLPYFVLHFSQPLSSSCNSSILVLAYVVALFFLFLLPSVPPRRF